MLNNLDIDSADCYMDFVGVKKLPNSTDKSIVVIPKLAVTEEEYFSLDCYILIVENTSGRILSKYFESNKTNEWYSDATTMDSIKIDIGPYTLNKEKRAFAIRVKYSGPSRVNPYYGEFISLFVQESDSLMQVLKRYPIAKFNGEWDGMCKGEFIDQRGLIIIESEMTNGYSNIKIKSKNTTTTRTPKGDDCIEKEIINTVYKTLKYNGKEYKNVL